ncbi:hypothetical protein [Burkholderia cenocepacia]|uniref:hypothetical protein n=1 Tax=Burkholderia cenocepacia TaxID=95486 RepID=UPI002AB2C769|nr:hypothetical protein [Burkholderia cenocepacia]
MQWRERASETSRNLRLMDKRNFELYDLSLQTLAHGLQRPDVMAAVLETTPRAATKLLGPTGTVIGDSLHTEEGIAYATFDFEQCVEPKQFLDTIGYYNRFDVFDIAIDRLRLNSLNVHGQVRCEGAGGVTREEDRGRFCSRVTDVTEKRSCHPSE